MNLLRSLKSTAERLITQLTAGETFNTDLVICPLHNFSVQLFDAIDYNLICDAAIKALDVAKHYFSADAFQFKYRLLDQMLATLYIQRITELTAETNVAGVAFKMLDLSIDLCSVYRAEKLYQALIHACKSIAARQSSINILSSVCRLFSVSGSFRTKPDEALGKIVVECAQVQLPARRLLLQLPQLFDHDAAVLSCTAALKAELALSPEHQDFDGTYERVCELASVVLEHHGSTTRAHRLLVQQLVEQPFATLNKLCFDSQLKHGGCSTSSQPENLLYLGETICLVNRLIIFLRKQSPECFRLIANTLLVQDDAELTVTKNEIKSTTGSVSMSVCEQMILSTLNQQLTPESLLSINSALNTALTLLKCSYLTPRESILTSGSLFQRTRINEAVKNLTTQKHELQKLDGDLLSADGELNRLAQISAGVFRHSLVKGGDLEPLFCFALRCIKSSCQVLLNNDFSGDEGAEVVFGQQGEEIQQHSHQFSDVQIIQLRDFFAVAMKLMEEMALANPLLIAQIEKINDIMLQTLQKIGRYTAFIKANATIFMQQDGQEQWMGFSEVFREAGFGPDRLKAIGMGFTLAVMKGEKIDGLL